MATEEEAAIQVRGNAANQPSQAIVKRYTAQYQNYLSTGDLNEWEQFQKEQIPSSYRVFFDDLRQMLRLEYHTQHAFERRITLRSLLGQTPPFTLNQEDIRQSKARSGQKKRYQQFDQFVKRFATKSAVGVYPFFASLKRILEYQGSGNVDRSCQWILDDAVLMETGGKDWMESVVWIMKGVLLFTEEVFQSAENSVREEEDELLRKWTFPTSISDPECCRLARLIPSYVLSHRGRGSQAIQRIIYDEEMLKQIDLPTGVLNLSDTLRDSDYRGSLVVRLWTWLTSWY